MASISFFIVYMYDDGSILADNTMDEFEKEEFFFNYGFAPGGGWIVACMGTWARDHNEAKEKAKKRYRESRFG